MSGTSFLFTLTERDLDLIKEISLAGVISGKIAKGDYIQDPDYGLLKENYDSCATVNAALHKKLNRVRRALSAEELVTERPENELD